MHWGHDRPQVQSQKSTSLVDRQLLNEISGATLKFRLASCLQVQLYELLSCQYHSSMNLWPSLLFFSLYFESEPQRYSSVPDQQHWVRKQVTKEQQTIWSIDPLMIHDLKEHLQLQLKRILWRLLEREVNRRLFLNTKFCAFQTCWEGGVCRSMMCTHQVFTRNHQNQSVFVHVFSPILIPHILVGTWLFLLNPNIFTARWNSSSWSFLQRMVPEDLLLDAMQWLHENIPPEGLPIWGGKKRAAACCWKHDRQKWFSQFLNKHLEYSRNVQIGSPLFLGLYVIYCNIL